MFDAFKNVLNVDRTYMRDDYQMEGWAFINFIDREFTSLKYRTNGLPLKYLRKPESYWKN